MSLLRTEYSSVLWSNYEVLHTKYSVLTPVDADFWPLVSVARGSFGGASSDFPLKFQLNKLIGYVGRLRSMIVMAPNLQWTPLETNLAQVYGIGKGAGGICTCTNVLLRTYGAWLYMPN